MFGIPRNLGKLCQFGTTSAILSFIGNNVCGPSIHSAQYFKGL